ncbi:MAG TPA: hypothetical protein VNS02_08715, partial [Rhizobiaceae bacterium]|nr:hypothetical protein [Rhizobiaceae bacterium]
SLMTCSAGAFPVPDFCLIFAPLKGYDEPKILRSQLSRFGPISADAGHRLHTHHRIPIGTELAEKYTSDPARNSSDASGGAHDQCREASFA